MILLDIKKGINLLTQDMQTFLENFEMDYYNLFKKGCYLLNKEVYFIGI